MSDDIWTPIIANRGRRGVSETRYRELSTRGLVLEPGARAFVDRQSGCSIFVGQLPGTWRWHLSIAHPDRYPGWDEIADARYALVPDEAMMVMILPPRGEYVNVHAHTFHLHEVPEARDV